MKKSSLKSIHKGMVRFNELEEVLLDVECSMNIRPLCYQGDQFNDQVLTPNILETGKLATLLKKYFDLVTKGLRNTKSRVCDDHLRKRCLNEYVNAIKERKKAWKKRSNVKLPAVESMVLIKDDVKD